MVSPNERGGVFSTLAGVGKIHAGLYRFDNVFFRRGGNLMVGDLLGVADTMQIAEYGLLTHYEATPSFVNWLDLTVENLTIDADSRIEVSARGYSGGKSWQEKGRTRGNVYGSARGAGGSYGGLGGGYQGAVPNPGYGDLTNPLDLGSGGGAWDNEDGGDGGGLILIKASHIPWTVPLRPTAERATAAPPASGSGGGINILTQSLSGAGFVQANGGGQGTGVGGGGGRIAVFVRDNLSFPR